MKNPLLELKKLGQSFWYDNIRRDYLISGEIKRMIEEEGVTGITSNPSIFYKSIKNTHEYDNQLKDILKNNPDKSEKHIFFELAVKDIQDACDLFLDIYNKTSKEDGYVSIEVDPNLAYDSENTIKEAIELYKKIDRPNVMIKVPSTKQGLEAIEELIYQGININVTLIFSLQRYKEVISSYLKGLERREKEGKDISSIFSVASFFVSRIDTLTDKYLDKKVQEIKEKDVLEKINKIRGRVAVACSKKAYQIFKQEFNSERFLKLKEKNAKIQKLLFASTSTKNPSYKDTLYVEELIGENTINTMPDVTWKAFKKIDKVEKSIENNLEEIEFVFNTLKEVNIDLEKIAHELETQGVKLFIESFNSILNLIKEKRQTLH